MEIEYLSFHGTQCTAESSTKGILFGANARPMVNLKIASTKFKKFVNIIFLVDTGSPCLYVCEKAMIALGFSDHIPMSFDVLFNNLSFEAVMSPLVMPNGEVGHYKDINLIGATFLSKARAKLIIDYKINEVIMELLDDYIQYKNIDVSWKEVENHVEQHDVGSEAEQDNRAEVEHNGELGTEEQNNTQS
jgi:hypothetical protein